MLLHKQFLFLILRHGYFANWTPTRLVTHFAVSCLLIQIPLGIHFFEFHWRNTFYLNLNFFEWNITTKPFCIYVTFTIFDFQSCYASSDYFFWSYAMSKYIFESGLSHITLFYLTMLIFPQYYFNFQLRYKHILLVFVFVNNIRHNIYIYIINYIPNIQKINMFSACFTLK